MKKNEFRALINHQFINLVGLTESKGEEYARSDADQLANFKRQSVDLEITPEKVLLVYLNKHIDSIKSYVNLIPHVKDISESIESRIDDAILYLILLRAMVVERNYQPGSIEYEQYMEELLSQIHDKIIGRK